MGDWDMTYTPTDQQIAALAGALLGIWDDDMPIASARDITQTPAFQSIIRAAQAEALQEAAVAWRWSASSNTPRHTDPARDRIAAANYAGDWLDERAMEIKEATA